MTKSLDSTAVYAYTTLISVIICVPWALLAEGGSLAAGIDAAVAKVGAQRFYLDLVAVGLLYHLYNQVRACGRMQARGFRARGGCGTRGPGAGGLVVSWGCAGTPLGLGRGGTHLRPASGGAATTGCGGRGGQGSAAW